MINKFFKTIHNKYSKFFNFIFFLRYLFLIFFIFITLFLNIPKFFDYEKRLEIIQSKILETYNFKIDSFEKIKFKALPLPRLEFKNTIINSKNTGIKLAVKDLTIFPKLFSIYNYKNFKIKKVILNNNNIFVETSALNNFTQNFLKQKNKLLIKNLNLYIIHKNKPLVGLENIVFANYGYNKNFITGKIFKKKFKVETQNDFNNIKIKLIKSGISADIDLNETRKLNIIDGIFKLKALNTNLRFNFNYNTKLIKIYKSHFRSKNLSFNNNSLIILKPFFDIESKFEIEDINTALFKEINFNGILKIKDIIKKLNLKSEINFKSKKFIRDNLIDQLNLNIDLAYGRINYTKQFLFSNNIFKCKGNTNILEEYPLLFFDCKLLSNNEQKLLKEFSINSKNKNIPVELNVVGNLNILNNKINFYNIILNKNYNATKEDLQYYKTTFENILFDNNFMDIFNVKKIKKFILEII